MSYLIILIVVVLAISPIFQFLPSPRQKLIVRLRETAFKNGLYVECCKDAELELVKESEFFDGRELMFYGLRRSGGKTPLVDSMSWVRDRNGWCGDSISIDLSETLEKLPRNVIAVKIDSTTCGVFWTENGSENDVCDIANLLRVFKEDSDRF